ncbi:stress responsive A/B barrel domain protein [Xylaria sp. FL1042]|nr:stress responsive A/B barrel domain protein [Xylaria sp. FL1042]
MTLIHIVLFRFKADVTKEQGDAFLREVKSFKTLPCVKDGRLIVGGPSLTNPIELAKGYKFALISHHENLEALEQYQASKEQHRDGLPYMDPLDYEELCRFDFEVDPAPLSTGNIGGK